MPRKTKPLARPTDTTPLLNVGEASRRTGLSLHLVRKLCREGEIVAYLILGNWRIDPVSLDRYMSGALNA